MGRSLTNKRTKKPPVFGFAKKNTPATFWRDPRGGGLRPAP